MDFITGVAFWIFIVILATAVIVLAIVFLVSWNVTGMFGVGGFCAGSLVTYLLRKKWEDQ